MGERYRVSCVSIPSLCQFNDVSFFTEHFRLRQVELNEKLRWQMPQWRGLEYDDLDTPAATYFIVRGDRQYARFGDVAGAARVVPTMSPTGYMLRNSFGHAVQHEALPVDPLCWEGSRAVINDELPREERRQVFRLFVASYLEFLNEQKAQWMYGLAIPKVWERWTQSGWPVTHLGPLVPFGDGTEGTAGKLPINQHYLKIARANAGLDDKPILEYGDKKKGLIPT